MQVQLRLAAADLSPEGLSERARHLCRQMNAQPEMKASLVEGQAEAGSKGGAIELGAIAIGFVTSGALKACLDILKVFLEQRGGGTRSVEVAAEKGAAFTLTLADLAPERLEGTLDRLRKLGEGKAP